jgi:mycoredoxin
MLRRWGLSIFGLVCGALLARSLSSWSPWAAGAAALLFVVLAVARSPLAFPRSVTAAQAQALSAVDGRPVVYWRPGCPYCLRLRRRLGRNARRVHWVDIWSDPAGAAVVRAATGGDETVPTVVIGAESHVNPEPTWLRDLVRAR